MIPLKTLIVEDEEHVLKDLLAYLNLKPYNSIISVASVSTNCTDTIDILLEESFQLSILDIQLTDGTCFDILEKIPRDNFGEIVFCSAFGGIYLEELTAAKPIHYLTKSFSKQKVQEMIISVEKFFRSKLDSDHYLWLFRNHTGKKVAVNKKDILFIESSGDKSIFYFRDDNGQYADALDPHSLTKQLNRLDNKFVQCNRTQIINVDFLREGESNNKEGFDAIMPNNKLVKISRKFKDSVFGRKGIR